MTLAVVCPNPKSPPAERLPPPGRLPYRHITITIPHILLQMHSKSTRGSKSIQHLMTAYETDDKTDDETHYDGHTDNSCS